MAMLELPVCYEWRHHVSLCHQQVVRLQQNMAAISEKRVGPKIAPEDKLKESSLIKTAALNC